MLGHFVIAEVYVSPVTYRPFLGQPWCMRLANALADTLMPDGVAGLRGVQCLPHGLDIDQVIKKSISQSITFFMMFLSTTTGLVG